MKSKKITFLLLVFSCISLSSFAQLETGILLSGGRGSVDATIRQGSILDRYLQEGSSSSVDYRFNAALGYRFRLRAKQCGLFYDFDINLGMKATQYEYQRIGSEPDPDDASIIRRYHHGSSAQMEHYYISLGTSLNYKIIKGLSLGLGVEPTYFIKHSAIDAKKMDFPLIGKIGYNFGFLELSANYKYGLVNVLKSEEFDAGKLRDWQIQLYIPF